MRIGLLDYHDFESDACKVAALYFDRLAVAMPEGMSRAYRRWHMQGLIDAGLLNEVALTEDEIRQSTASLAELIKDHAGILQAKYGFAEFWPSNGYAAELLEGWFTHDFASIAKEANLGHIRDNGYDAMRLRLAEQVGQLYRSCLYESVAKRRSFALASTRHSFYSGAAAWDNDALLESLAGSNISRLDASSTGLPESRLAVLAMRAVLPDSLADFDIPQILSIRERSRAELTELQDHLQTLATSDDLVNVLKGASSIGDVERYLQIEYERNIEPQLKQLERSFGALKIKTVWGAISLKTATPPAVASALSGLIPGGPAAQAATIGTGLALGLANGIIEARSSFRELRQKSPLSYLLAVKKAQPSGLIARYRKNLASRDLP